MVSNKALASSEYVAGYLKQFSNSSVPIISVQESFFLQKLELQGAFGFPETCVSKFPHEHV